jgi:RND family efflux transporter MFP subunit
MLFMSREPVQIQEPEVLPITIEVARAVKTDIRIPIAAQGTVTPHRQTSLVAEVQGRILEVSPAFNAGGFISQGDVLMHIDARDYQASLLRAQANVASAHSALVQERGRAEVASREWEKLPKTSRRSEEAIELYLRKPQLEQAEAQLSSAQADLQKARDDLDRTVIRAPYDALILAKHGELGQYVAPGTPLADIFAVDFAEVRLPIPQSRLAYLDLPPVSGFDRESAPEIELFTEMGGEVQFWSGYLHRTEGVFDERSRVLYSVVRVPDPYALHDTTGAPLRMGTFVHAIIPGKRMSDLVVLPRSAMHSGNELWIVDDNNQLRRRQVSVLRTEGDEIFVSSGLDEGDLVCLTVLDNSFAGALVEIISTVDTQTGSGLLEGESLPRERVLGNDNRVDGDQADGSHAS